MKQYLYLILFTLFTQSLLAQSKLPVIKATSKNVAINDGGVYMRDAWNLSPKARPDIYTADRTRETKWVTFYTDMDSIRVKVKPGTRYNFIILLNGKDSCYTQIASAVPPETKLQSSKPDTIPFKLTAYNAIGVKALINGTDTLNLHFDISSTGIHFLRDVIAKKLKQQKVASLQMGSMIWHNPAVNATNATAREMDGRFGFDLFEGKQVEINYDRNLLVIHSRLPKELKGYVRSKLEFSHGYALVKGTFPVGQQQYTGIFSMDTGSAEAMVLDSAWAAHGNLAQQFKLIRISAISDGGGKKYETKVMRAPNFELSSFQLANVPTTIFNNNYPTGFELNFLGNDLLKRFNMILDLKNDYIYLKANKLLKVPYRG